QSTFLASGMYACPGDFPPSFSQPVSFFFVTDCPGTPAGSGNLGDIWTSSDGGATWTSARATGALPKGFELVGDPPALAMTELGRINLAAVPGATAAQAVVYAVASNQDGSHTTAVLRSDNGGALWGFTSFGQLTVPDNPNSDCQSLDIGHDQ